jgi:hypothetical protein
VVASRAQGPRKSMSCEGTKSSGPAAKPGRKMSKKKLSSSEKDIDPALRRGPHAHEGE